MTKVPLAESRRLFVFVFWALLTFAMAPGLSGGQEEEGEKQGEVEGEVEEVKDNRTSWMVWIWGWNGKRVNGLEPCGV